MKNKRGAKKIGITYHNILVPLLDIFEISGSDVFKEFGTKKDKEGKNVVVLPLAFLDNLRVMKDSGNEAAAEALSYIADEVTDYRKVDENVFLGKLSDNLDIAILHRRGLSSPHDINKIIQDNFRIEGGKPARFITRDEVSRIEFGSLGLNVQEPRFLRVSTDIIRDGIIDGNKDLEKILSEKKSVSLAEAKAIMNRNLYINQFLRFTGHEGYEYARVCGELQWNEGKTRITEVKNPQVKLLSKEMKLSVGEHQLENILGIKPLNMEQYLAMQYGLLQKDISLFFLCGRDGTGKTLLTYVSAVEQILEYRQKEICDKRGNEKENFFRQMILLRPLDKGVEKISAGLYKSLRHYLGPYEDAHRLSYLGNRFDFEEMFRHPYFDLDGLSCRGLAARDAVFNDDGKLPSSTEAIRLVPSGQTYISGRSFANSIVLVDEAQNFTPYELKTIIQRMGLGTKMIISGDPNQISNPQCSREINGLTHAINYFQSYPYCGLVNLTNNQRAEMAEDSIGM